MTADEQSQMRALRESARQQLDELYPLPQAELNSLALSKPGPKLEKAVAFADYTAELCNRYPDDNDVKFANAAAQLILAKTKNLFGLLH